MSPLSRSSGPLLAALLTLGGASVAAQSRAPLPRESASQPQGRAQEQQIERIRHQDAGSRIDELRVGGETKQITVRPKGDAPAYEVAPESNNRNPAASDQRGGSGSSGWKIFGF